MLMVSESREKLHFNDFPSSSAKPGLDGEENSSLDWRLEGASFCLESSLEDPSSILAKFCNLVQPFSGFGKLYGQVGTFDGFTPQKIFIT